MSQSYSTNRYVQWAALRFLIVSPRNTFNNHWLETWKVAKTESLSSPISNLALESYPDTVPFISHPPSLSTYVIFILLLSPHRSFLPNFFFSINLRSAFHHNVTGFMHYLVPYSSKNFRLSQLKQNHLTCIAYTTLLFSMQYYATFS